MQIVKSSAKDAFNKDMVYRRWSALNGGVYVPVTETTPPNPLLVNVPERDIVTPSGKKLTLINPAYMTRQVHELGAQQFGLRAHITSLNPIRPANAADEWEKQALQAFEQGVPEMSSLGFIDGKEYFRYMGPMVTEKGCLKCHAFQGYKIGEIRGGLSVSVPWEPVHTQLRVHMIFIFLTYSGIWILGLVGGGFILKMIYNDLERQKKMEEDIRKSEQKYRSLFDNMDQGMALHEIILDPAGNAVDYRFLEANHSFEILTGLKRENIIGETVLEVLPGTEQSWIEKYGNVVATGVPLHYENYSKDLGKYYSVVAYRSQPGQFAVIVSDITGSRRNEEEIVKKNQELRKLNAEKDKFFSIIAHDLKNPFNSILGFSELLKNEAHKQKIEDVVKYAGVINSSAQNTFELLENLLEWSLIQQGRIPFDPHTLLLNRIVEAEIENLTYYASQKNILIGNGITASIIIEADEDMLSTILRNLMANAIKFTPKNGKVQVLAKIEERQVVISVSDTGVGMTGETIGKLFKIETSFTSRGTENEKGTGLGLILCKEFVEKHNGKIWVESEVGKGSVFSFTIPDNAKLTQQKTNHIDT